MEFNNVVYFAGYRFSSIKIGSTMKKTAKFLDAIGCSMQAFFVHKKRNEISHQISSILEYPEPLLQLSSK